MPEVRNVTPSQPQYGRRSFVHMRIAGTHVPGELASQPSPSHTPDAHSVPARQLPPSGTAPAALPDDGSRLGSVVVDGGGPLVVGGCFGADEHAQATSASATKRERIRGR